MKNIFKLFGIIALLAVIGFTAALSLTGCSDGGGGPSGGPPPDPETETYTGTANGKTYTLKITKAAVTPPGGTNPFVGTWNGTDKDGDDLTVIFTTTTWTASGDYISLTTGTYIYSGNMATILYNSAAVGTAVISGSTLMVTGESLNYTPWTLTRSGGSLSVLSADSARTITPAAGDDNELTADAKKSKEVLQAVAARSGSRSVMYASYTARAITPAVGDDYELTVGAGAGAKKSMGAVKEVRGETLILKPTVSAVTFDATTTSGNGLTDVTGLITFDDGEEEWGPGPLTPGSDPGPGPGPDPGDGSLTWTTVTNSPFGSTAIAAIAYGNGKFVAVGRGKMAYSSNGVIWTAVEDCKFTNSIYDITYGDDKFVAVGSFGRIAYSYDGVTWTAAANSVFGSGSTSEIFSVAYGNGRFVAGALGGLPVMMATSEDGITWTAVSNRDSGFNTGGAFNNSYASIRAITWGGDRFVAVGDITTGNTSAHTRVAYSSDGLTWTHRGDSGYSFELAIGYGDGMFVAGGYNRIATSANGTDWNFVDLSSIFSDPYTEIIMADIAYGINRFIIVGASQDDSYNVTNKMAYSTDGTTWESVNIPSLTSFRSINAIAYGNNRFVIGGYDGKMAYSGGGGVNTTAVAWSGLTANGTANSVTTTALTLTFDKDPVSLTIENITVTGATKGALSGSGTTRTLNISDVTVPQGANVTVALTNPSGYTVTPNSRAAELVTIHFIMSVPRIGATPSRPQTTAATVSVLPAPLSKAL